MKVSKRKRLVHFAAACIGAGAVVILGVGPALAVHDDDLFELGPGLGNDGTTTGPEHDITNILGDTVLTNGPDWADIFNASGGVISLFGGNAAAFVKDDVSAGNLIDNTVYSGGPSDKNKDIVADWTWSSSSVPAKTDISNAYAYVVIRPSDGHLIIYAGVEREDPSGDSHIDLEFFQNTIALDEDPPCVDPGEQNHTCSFTGSNKDGDLLINMDFSQGGSFGGVSIRKRHEGVTNNYDLITSLGTQGCNLASGTLDADSVCAFANGAPIDGGPWDNFDNHGAVITTVQTNAFTEFGVDVTEALGTTPCFSTVQVKTRSSGSFTATLKDFALHGFQQCTASATTQIHSGASVGATHNAPDIQTQTVPVGTTVHDKAIVTGTIGFDTPTGDVTFNRFANGTCSGTPASTETVDLTETASPTPSTAGVAAAESSSFTTSAAGGLSYQAVYNGDTNYPTPVTSDCEPLTVAKTNSAVNTDIRQGNVNGSSVLDTHVGNNTTVVDVGTITGSAPGTPDPTGTVTFQRFANANCSGTPASSEDKTLVADLNPNDGTATAVSSTYTTSAAGGEFVSYKVIYSGDGVYFASTATVCEPICSFANSPTLP